MGILTKVITFPVRAPAGGALWVATKLAEQVETERNSPAALRAALAEAERQLLSGALSEWDYDAIEDDLLARLSRAGGG